MFKNRKILWNWHLLKKCSIPGEALHQSTLQIVGFDEVPIIMRETQLDVHPLTHGHKYLFTSQFKPWVPRFKIKSSNCRAFKVQSNHIIKCKCRAVNLGHQGICRNTVVRVGVQPGAQRISIISEGCIPPAPYCPIGYYSISIKQHRLWELLKWITNVIYYVIHCTHLILKVVFSSFIVPKFVE